MNNLFTILKWIEKFEIDGFRIISNGSAMSIKNNVLELCERCRILGKKWRILGFYLNKEKCIENSGLQSVFDKQSRLDLIQGIAEDENCVNYPFIEKNSRVHRTADEKGFCLSKHLHFGSNNKKTWRFNL